MKPFKASEALASDLQEAYDYFKRGGPAAAERFSAAFERTLRTVCRHPEICRLRGSGWRHAPIPGSSYVLFYRESPSFWFVGAVISMLQDPDVIQAQLLIREISDEGLTTP
jgi:plasmid stabilization system protein ParE